MMDICSQFQAAIEAAGLEPPAVILPGKMYRFPGIGKAKDNNAGWCKLFGDQLGGCFGDWSTGLSESWHLKDSQKLTKQEQQEFNQRVKTARLQAKAEIEANHQRVAEEARAIWEKSKTANNEHPYLVRKNINAKGIRLNKDTLVIPMYFEGGIFSIQFIYSDGSKRFLSGGRTSGCYFSLGNPRVNDVICITEGYATGSTIHQATGYPVAVAFNAGNLQNVTEVLKERFPKHLLVICADDDVETKGNPGLSKAKQVSEKLGVMVAVPFFGEARPSGVSDFNDMAAISGLNSIASIVDAAINQNNEKEWLEPEPLSEVISAEPYPLDALPELVLNAVEEVAAFTKAPLPMVACSALTALSLAIQPHVDIERAKGLTGPTSLFLLTIANSGERKSTCDGFFINVIRDYEVKQQEIAKPKINDHHAELAAWDEKCRGLKEQIRALAKTGKSTATQEQELSVLIHNKPISPRIPRLIYSDITPEALKYNLAKIWPSGGVVSSEAGIVFGSHGMNNETVMRNLATLNQLWDGGVISTERRGSESFTVKGARYTMALQIQEATLKNFLDRSKGLARDTGFLARFLIAWPESTQGKRHFSEPPESWPSHTKFNQRILEILSYELSIDEHGSLSPSLKKLSPEAKKLWVRLHDTVESELGDGGDLNDIRDVASNIADNAARLAALFKVFNHGIAGDVGVKKFESAARIALWHLLEAKRFLAGLNLSSEQTDVVQLDKWLIGYCVRQNTAVVSRRDIQRNIVPSHLRQKEALNSALNKLVELNRIRQIQDDKRKEIHINPFLIKRG